MNKGLWGASLFLVILGLVFICTALIFQTYRKNHEVLSASVMAMVVDVVSVQEDAPGDSYQLSHRFHPVFEYYAEGKLFREEYPEGFLPGRFRVGDVVKLNYNPSDPSEYEMADSSPQKINLPALLEAAGVFCLVLGMLLFISFASRY